jgi:hypothetical protein
MNRLTIIGLLFFFGQHTLAQSTFCPEGARWLYENIGSANNFHSQVHYEYSGDTTISNHSDVRVIKQEWRGELPWGETFFQQDTSYTWQSGDSIFQYVDGNFELAFDLNVDVGDTRVVYFAADLCFNHDTMLIEDIDTMEYQGHQLRRFHYKLLIEDQMSLIEGPGQAGSMQSQYVERLGFITDHPTANGFRCEGNLISEYEPKTFRCYTDNELANNFPDTCQVFLSTIEQQNAQFEIEVRQGQLIVNDASNSNLKVFNVQGKELFRKSIMSDNYSIDISHLPNGILLAVVEKDSTRVTKKFAKTGF